MVTLFAGALYVFPSNTTLAVYVVAPAFVHVAATVEDFTVQLTVDGAAHFVHLKAALHVAPDHANVGFPYV